MSRLLRAITVAPLLVLLPACARQSHPSADAESSMVPSAAVRAAPDRALQAGSGRFDITMEIHSTEGPERLDLRSSGSFDLALDRTEMELDTGRAFEALGVDAPEGLAEPTRVVLDGERAYMRSRLLEDLSGQPGWLAIDATQLGGDDGPLRGVGGTDPAQMLEVLRRAPDSVEVLGDKEIRGVTTTRYRFTVDPKEGRLDGVGPAMEDVPVEVWMDEEGLVRRLRISLDGPEAAEGGMTVDFFDYGAPVGIDVPSPADVTSFSDALAGLADSLAGAGA